jgi:hypothetical protein
MTPDNVAQSLQQTMLTLVDDVGVQARQVERGHRADQLEQEHHREWPAVRRR